MTKTANKLAVAKTDLIEAEAGLEAILDGEDAAAASSVAYQKWRIAADAARSEVDRLTRLASKLEADVATEAAAQAAEAQAELEKSAEEAAAAAAAVITEGMTSMHEISRRVMAAIATSNLKIERAQRGRSPDLPPLQTAEQRARRSETVDRSLLSERTFEAWSYRDQVPPKPLSDELVAGVTVGPGKNRGGFRTDSGFVHVARRQFRELRYLPELAAEIADPLAETLSVPPIRAGGPVGWSPIRHAHASDLLRAIDAIDALGTGEDRRRQIIEVICLGDAVSDDVAA